MKRTSLLLASLAFSLAAPPAWPEESPVPKAAAPAVEKDAKKEALSERDERKFAELSALYCKAVYPVKEDYLILPNYNATFPSSRGLSRVSMFNQLTDALVERRQNFNNGLVIQEKKEKKVPPVKEDVEAACALRNLNQGEYGELQSVHVVKILGKDEMLVDDARLFDARASSNLVYSHYRNGDPNQKVQKLWQEVREAQEKISRDGNGASRLFRLVGYSTMGLREGDRWNGPEGKKLKVAVGRAERAQVEQKNRFRSYASEAVRGEELTLLANPDKLGKSIERKEFEAFLAKWKISKAEFLEICKLAAEENKNSEKAKAAVLWQLGAMGEKAAAAEGAKAAQEAAQAQAQAQAQIRAAQAAQFAAEMERQAARSRERNNWRTRQQQGGAQDPSAPPSTPAQPKFQPQPDPVAAPGTPIFKTGEEALQPKAQPQAQPQPQAAGKYVLVPPNAQVDALVDLKNRDILAKLIIGRWQAKDAATKPYWRVCAADGTYQEFDANDKRTGSGAYRVTNKGQLVLINDDKSDLLQFAFTSPNAMDDGAGASYQRVVPK